MGKGLIPGDSFPSPLAPFSLARHGLKDSFLIVLYVNAGKPPDTDLPTAVGIFRISQNPFQAVVLEEPDDAASGHA